MAGFRMHITVSTLCGLGYGAAAVKPLGFPPETAFLAAGVTAVGGMLPDLDSDSGVPVRELSGLAAAVIPLLLVPRLDAAGMSTEGILATLGLSVPAHPLRAGVRAPPLLRPPRHVPQHPGDADLRAAGLPGVPRPDADPAAVGRRGDARVPVAPGAGRDLQCGLQRRAAAAEPVRGECAEVRVAVVGGDVRLLRPPRRAGVPGVPGLCGDVQPGDRSSPRSGGRCTAQGASPGSAVP